jgi:NAD(P)-dependent dehydrogenase (short-subunit alcohol dehydrogenase family)
VIRAALPQLRSQGSGHIVQISSLEGVAPILAGETAYAATKFAAEGLCEALAMEVRHLGIRVTIVEPGPVRTDFAAGAVAEPSRIDDYDASVGEALRLFEQLAGNQPNDPARVAAAVVEAIEADEPPLRLVLGTEAVDAVRAKLDGQRGELDAWERVARSTAVPA